MTGGRRRLFVDVTPLRESREFRLLFSGLAVSQIGTQLTVVAAPIQVYDLTGSSFAVGLLGAAQLVPLLIGSLVGGSLADTVDRRRQMVVAQVLLLLTSAGLGVNAGLDRPSVAAVYVLTALQAGVSGIDHPARASAIPVLVGPTRVASAAALSQLVWQLGSVVGPALAGLIIATAGLATTYWLDAGTFLATLATLALMRPINPQRRHGSGRASVVEGLRFLRGRQALQGSFVIDINAMVFGMPKALFPAMADTVFGGGAGVAGLLYAAPGAGALLGAATSGWVGRVDQQGRAVLLAVLAWGAAIAAFGLVGWLPLALLLLAVAGAADVVSAVFRNSILQLSVPDRLRGRLSSVHIAVVTGGPRLGDVESGAVAAVIGPQASVVTGGLACMAGVGVIARLMPALGAWRLRDHVDGVADDEVEADGPEAEGPEVEGPPR